MKVMIIISKAGTMRCGRQVKTGRKSKPLTEKIAKGQKAKVLEIEEIFAGELPEGADIDYGDVIPVRLVQLRLNLLKP